MIININDYSLSTFKELVRFYGTIDKEKAKVAACRGPIVS